MVRRWRPVAGSRTSLGAPVPGRQSARNGSSQVVGAVAAIWSLLSVTPVAVVSGRWRLSARLGGLGPAAGRRVAPDRSAREDLVDEPFLEVGRVLPRVERLRDLARVAEPVADVLVGVVAADDREQQRRMVVGLVALECREAGGRIVAELGPQRQPQRLRPGRGGP